MKKIFILFVLILGFSTDALAQSKRFGLGVILGEPTGITGKYFFDQQNAIDFAAAWSFEADNSFDIHADYIRHQPTLMHSNNVPIPFYYGVGGRLVFDDDTRFGARFPLGLYTNLETEPVELFAEIAPIVDLAPSTKLRINAGVGFRYYF